MLRIIPLGALALFASSIAIAQAVAPMANPDAPSNAAVKDNSVATTATAAEGANSFTEGQAHDRMAAAGFTNISGLRKDSDGLWQAKARKAGKSVAVALDYKGNVTSK